VNAFIRSPRSPRSWRARRRRAGGYTLAVCAVLITLMSIAVAVALPQLSTQIRREREEELIFRGLQMAEGIRLFQRRFGRFPVRLEELWETEPRCVRQPWKDPMTEGGRWRVITQGGAAVPGIRQGGLPGDGDEDNGDEDDGGGDLEPSDLGGPGGQQGQSLPIIGVRSRGKGESFKSFFGQTRIEAWRFTADQVTQVQGAAVPGGTAQPIRIPNANWIGRPLPGMGNGGPGMDNGLTPSDLNPGVQPGKGGPNKGGYQGAGVPGGIFPQEEPPTQEPPPPDDGGDG
jgi:type II secretory pathway pseudopilin PulG